MKTGKAEKTTNDSSYVIPWSGCATTIKKWYSFVAFFKLSTISPVQSIKTIAPAPMSAHKTRMPSAAYKNEVIRVIRVVRADEVIRVISGD